MRWTKSYCSASLLQPLPPQLNYLWLTVVRMETNDLFLPLSPAKHPRREHLPCRPVWVGHVREGEFTREICLEAVLRAWPGWGVCHYYCLQHSGTAELASEDIRLQVQNCSLPAMAGGVGWCLHFMGVGINESLNSCPEEEGFIGNWSLWLAPILSSLPFFVLVVKYPSLLCLIISGPNMVVSAFTAEWKAAVINSDLVSSFSNVC